MIYYVQYIFYGIPVASLLFFIISLYRFIHAKRKNKAEPGSISAKEMKSRKILLIIASVIAGVLIAVVAGFMILLYMAVSFM